MFPPSQVMEDIVKLLIVAAVLALSLNPSAEAAGWRTCQGQSAKCVQARQNAAKPARAARSWHGSRSYHDSVNRLSTRDFFFRRMLDN